jgi:hypothetical protein
VNGLSGKRILFISIGFYDYEASIVHRLRELGAVVHAFLDRPMAVRQGVLRASLAGAGIDLLELTRRHQRDIMRRSGDTRYDYVLIIKAEDLMLDFLQELRDRQAAASFILYQWDSLARVPGIEERLGFFDRMLTFDRKDSAANPRFLFRPLFFREDTQAGGRQQPRDDGVDLCFIGWLHSDRLEMIRRLQAEARSRGMSFFVYLYTGLRTALKLALDKNGRDVHVRPLPYPKLLGWYRRTAVIVDLPHALQSGLTMRAIEAIGHGNKLLTSAVDVVNYDFYSEDNVHVMHAGDTELDPRFIRTPAVPYPPAVRRRYSLDGWIRDVFALSSPA